MYVGASQVQILGSELSELRWPTEMTHQWDSASGVLQMFLPTSSGGSSPSYTAGAGIDLSGNVVTNTKQAPAIKVGAYTYQPSQVSTLEFMHSTMALSGSTLQVMPTHTYYSAGSGIAFDSSNVIANTAQGSPNWDVTVMNGNTEVQIDGSLISAIKFPYQMTYFWSEVPGVLQL